jgi:nitroreductase
MDLNVAITGRRAVREYTAQAVDEKSIRALINAAIQAPSAVNQQPWTFTVVRDQSVLDRISREAKSHMLATMPPYGKTKLKDPSHPTAEVNRRVQVVNMANKTTAAQ